MQDRDTSNTILQLSSKSMAQKMDENKLHQKFPHNDHGNHDRARDRFHRMPMPSPQDADTSNTSLQLVAKSMAPKMDKNKSLIKELQVYQLCILFAYLTCSIKALFTVLLAKKDDDLYFFTFISPTSYFFFKYANLFPK